MKSTLLGLAALVLVARASLAQETALERARRALEPVVFEQLSSLASEAASRGVPDEPLYAKALEGVAKRVPPERLVPAVREYAGRLAEARVALGNDASLPLLVAGADALQRGVPREALGALPRERVRSPLAVLALAELTESGVPPERALVILREAVASRAADDAMLNLSARVRMLIRQGVPPQEAIERVRRLLRERGGFGPVLPPGSEPITRDRRLP